MTKINSWAWQAGGAHVFDAWMFPYFHLIIFPETPFVFDFVCIQSTRHLHTIMSSLHRTQNSPRHFPIWAGVNDMAMAQAMEGQRLYEPNERAQ